MRDRLSVRAFGFLVTAIATGTVSLLALNALITGYRERIDEAGRPEDTVMVLVAARDLYQGLPIGEEDLYAVQIPPKYLPEGVFLSPDHVVGRIPRERVLANELVRADRLADPESGIGLNAIVPRGLRASSVSLRDGAALSGLLNPGSYVDVVVTVRPDGGTGEAALETKTILQGAFVLGVDSRARRESAAEAEQTRGRHDPSVTLLVTPGQAEQLAHAEQLGDLRLLLRNDQDLDVVDLEGVRVDVKSLRKQLAPTSRVRVPPPEPVSEDLGCRNLRIVRGADVEDRRIDEDGADCP